MNEHHRNITAALLIVFIAAPAAAETRLSYESILEQLTDLDRLTRAQPGFEAGAATSWDRNGRNVWGANGDAGQYLRVEPDGEAVMMDQAGPGCIWRIWSANPQGKIRLYLDGAEKPTFEWDFNALFLGSMAPFKKPLVWQRSPETPASDAYLPIPFARHIKITADKAHGQYYHFNYTVFPRDFAVESFHLPLTAAESARLERALDVWGKPGPDPKPALPGQATIKMTVTLGPGERAVLADLDHPGIIRSIRAKVTSAQRYPWRKLVLEGEWDDAGWPQVLSPLGTFFGFDWDAAEYASVPAGCHDGVAYNHFPMPFRRHGRVSLKSYLEAPAEATVEIDWAPVKELPEDTLYFYARWRKEVDARTFDYPFLETAGRGHFVGIAMPIDHPLPGWWGEGDEKVWVDGDDWPRWIGTGSEDYFGDAWGIRYLNGPSWGASRFKSNRTCNYRWHFMDNIPFSKRMRMTIENYGPNGGGPRGHYEYTSTAFWYQAEKTPPFAELKGVPYTGGDDPAGKPTKQAYGTGPFPAITADLLRTYGSQVTFAQETEDRLEPGVGTTITDARLAYEFSRERAVDFGQATAGKELGHLRLTVDSAGIYYPLVLTAPEDGLAEVSFAVEGPVLPIAGRPEKGRLQLEAAFLEKGEQRVKLVAASAGRAVVDAVQLLPAHREGGALEAEEIAGTRASGGDAPRPSAPLREASAGRYLEWGATDAGQSLFIRFEKRPPLPYVLGARAIRGPDHGMIQAFAGGKAIGPAFDLYGPERRPADAVWPLGALPQGVEEVEVRVVGRSPDSKGFRVGLDYFRWEPKLLGPQSAEGVWAQILSTRGCGHTTQDLGPAYDGGHQLWINPSSDKARVDIGLHIPKEREYEIVIRATSSWDYADFQASLDGKPVGPVIKCFSKEVKLLDPVSLGKFPLTPGRHTLRLAVAGKSPDSQNYLMGIDYIDVR
jgi:D-arabinan exo alpha-(1,3)/(1,5)-arabinofuranosidase (non-reducing end)